MESTSELSLILPSSSSLDIYPMSHDIETGLHRFLSVNQIEEKIKNRKIEKIIERNPDR